MLFASMTFIFIFLPIVCTLHFFAKQAWQNLLLLLASFAFYAWGEPTYLAIMLITISINYFGALLIDKSTQLRKCLLFLVILSNLSILFYFKYLNFFLEAVSEISTYQFDLVNIIMPIGISFYTFQALSYVIDVYRKEVSVQKNIYDLALYITFFPQLIAGPIVKYHDISTQISNREVSFSKVEYGVKRFIIGLAKKVLIANTLGQVADTIFAFPSNEAAAPLLWLGIICYTLQLYYDFSGYSDMAIGLGSIFGFKFLENFNYPYISKSITEFWRRWHISLSTWFKEYLYIPLGGNRVSQSRVYLNLFLVFLCTGIWHGASWNFIIWGLWHGVFIIFEKRTNWHEAKDNFILRCTQHAYTILVFTIGWVFFRAENMDKAVTYLQGMLGLVDLTVELSFDWLSGKDIVILLVAILCALPLFRNMLHYKPSSRLYQLCLNVWLMLLFVYAVATIAASTYNPFIYFRF